MKKTHNFKRSLWLLSFLFLMNWGSQGQHIQNGGFESPLNAASGSFFIAANAGTDAITPWTVVSRVDIHHRGHWGYLGVDSQHADLNDDGQIVQTLTNLVPGVTYTVSFLTRIHNNCVTTATATGTVTGTSGVLGTININLASANPADLTWTARSFTFVADAATATIDFLGTMPAWQCGGVMLDDISVFGPCDAWVNIDTVDCDEYRFSSMSSVAYDAIIWYINGAVADVSNPIPLEKGTYEICFSYFGMDTVSGGDSLFCCGRICRTLVVEGIDTTYETDTACALPPNMYQYDPCQGGNFGFYTIIPTFPALHPCTPGALHPMGPGTYTILHYDFDTCLRWVENLTIVLKNPDTTTCYERHVECGPFIDPNMVFPDTVNCPDCYNPASGIVYTMTPPMVISIDTITATTRYRRMFMDPTNCRVCVFTFDIVDSACAFMPFFNVLHNNMFPYDFQFDQFFPTQNLCGNANWTITDTVNGTTWTSGPQANPGSWFFVFPSVPGIYRVKLNTCICVCNKMCCKESTLIIIIPANPLLSYIYDPQTGESYSPHQGGGTYRPLEEDDDSPKEEEAKPTPHIDGKVMRLVPNPTSSEFRIVIDGLNEQVYDAVHIIASDGKMVEAFTSMEATHVYHLEVAPGTYTVKVQVKESVFDTKLVIQK